VPDLDAHSGSTDHLGRRLPAFPTPLALPNPPALSRANDRIRLPNERRTAHHALTLGSRVFLPIRGSTFGVHAFRFRSCQSFVAARWHSRQRDETPRCIRQLRGNSSSGSHSEHPVPLLGHGLNLHFSAPGSRVSVSLAESGAGVYEPHCLRRSPSPGGSSVGTTAPGAFIPANRSRTRMTVNPTDPKAA
jgi:hypothetical protein